MAISDPDQRKIFFHNRLNYTSREEKASYAWQKYREFLNGKILDVGANKGYLSRFVGKDAGYVTLDIKPPADILLDLEKKKLPFKNNSFDCVLCLDVLEHLDNPHDVFDEICRVARRYVIISMPNPWAEFITLLRKGYYSPDKPMKFYNLPSNAPSDRHKWFYGVHEAEKFIVSRGKSNKMRLIKMDRELGYSRIKKWLYKNLLRLFVSNDVDIDGLLTGRTWVVLKKSAEK